MERPKWRAGILFTTSFTSDMTRNGAAAWGLRRGADCCSVWAVSLKWLRVTTLRWGIQHKGLILTWSLYPTWMSNCAIWLGDLCVCVILQRFIYDWPENIYGKYIILLISLDAQATFICISVPVQSVRKSFALSGVSGVLKCSPGALRELLRQDHQVCLRFTACLLGEK